MNEELLNVAKKAAKSWEGTDTYGQAAILIYALCEEIERLNKSTSSIN